ncbi:hypothetical protein M8C21_023188, partial [Ambrosia artemisiifolia]
MENYQFRFPITTTTSYTNDPFKNSERRGSGVVEEPFKNSEKQDPNNMNPDPVAAQLAAIASPMESLQHVLQSSCIRLNERNPLVVPTNLKTWVLPERRGSLKMDFEGRKVLSCGEKYDPAHRCKTGTFKLLKTSDNQEVPFGTKEEASGVQEELAEISLHVTFSKSHMSTMKLQGMLGTTEVLILVDSRSTLNFISDSLVRQLKIATKFMTQFGVQIGNGDII